MANNSRWLIERETSPSNQTPEANWSSTVAPQPRLEASDQNIWSGERRAREIPSSRQPSVHHHRRSSRERGSQGTRIPSSRNSQPRLRANCKAFIRSWPFGTRRDGLARFSRTLQTAPLRTEILLLLKRTFLSLRESPKPGKSASLS